MKPAYIYTLCDPRSGAVGYVGKTISPAQRLSQHKSHAKRRKYRSCTWICSLLSLGLSPVMRIVETVEGDGWPEREQYWIRHYREAGAKLKNLCDGGEGPVNPTPEARHKMGASNRGKKWSEERRRQTSAMRTGTKSPWTSERLKTWNKERTFSEETRAKIGAAQKGKQISEAHRRAVSAAQKGVKKPPEFGDALRARAAEARTDAIAKEAEALASGLTMAQMRAAGFSARAIGRVFGISHHAVACRLQKQVSS